MAKDPRNFSGEDMSRLLKAGDDWEKTKAGWKMTGHFGLIVAAVAVFIVAVVALLVQVANRLH